MRTFVAAWPSRQVVDALRRVRRPERPGVRWTTAPQWHVTLRFLGDVEPARIDPLASALAEAVTGLAPVQVELARRARRYGAAAVGVPVVGLEGVAAAVASVSGGRPERRFSGHLTIARTRGRVPRSATALVLPALRWTVEELTMVRSHLEPAGARYEVLRRVPLSGDSAPVPA